MHVHTVNFRRTYVDYFERELAAADTLRRRLLGAHPALAATAVRTAG
jgi:hypothetical protein